MLPKQYRLVLKKDFSDVRLTGKKYFHPLFTLQVLLTKDQPSSKFGFIVTNRLSKKATERNQTKRIFRQSIHQLLPRIKNGYKIIFRVNKIIFKPEAPLVNKEVEKVLTQSEILNNEKIRS